MSIHSGVILFACVAVVTWSSSSRAMAGEPLKVMTYNIRYDGGSRQLPENEKPWSAESGPSRRDMVLSVIDSMKPDLLGLQEALPQQVDDVAADLEGYESYSVGRDDGKRRGEHCSIYYRKDRFERLGEGTFWLCDTPDKPGSKHPDAACPRIASWILLADRENDGKQLVFLNMHWDHVGREAREFAAKTVIDQLAIIESADHAIVVGDLNSNEGSQEIERLLGDKRVPLVDAFRQVHPDQQVDELTFNGFRDRSRGKRIDFVMTSPAWKPIGAEIIRTQFDGILPSDHYPVVVELDLQK
ncbi:endonuclease/exonuclease/phosphatase family protein [Aeoliella sp. SH292]|uniref:endonuclease/exonuclease/phosphatase family protein n=1 Tax=Aeoliella sp. SH292 TaxID=3454464 RepID=UPI003F95C652